MRRREVGWKWCPGHNPSFVLVFNVPNVLVVSHHSFTPSHFVFFFSRLFHFLSAGDESPRNQSQASLQEGKLKSQEMFYSE